MIEQNIGEDITIKDIDNIKSLLRNLLLTSSRLEQNQQKISFI